MNSAAAVIVWSVVAAIVLGYAMLSLTARHNDGPWLAVLVAFGTVLGGVLYAMAISI